MVITIRRINATPKLTLGVLFINEIQMMTLEQPLRHLRLTGDGALRAGQYQILKKENGDLRIHDELIGRHVVFRSGRRIDGIAEIVVGNDVQGDQMRGSRRMFGKFEELVKGAMDCGEEVLADIIDPIG